jgi:two-component sensor histidine kinase
MAAAMTLPTRDVQDGDTLTAVLLADAPPAVRLVPDAAARDAAARDAARSGRREALRVASCSIRPVDDSLDAARSFVHRTARAWHVDSLADDLALVVTELVTNALRHGLGGGTPAAGVDVALYGTDSRVMCAVSDPSDEAPVRVTPDISHESGRGLQIVEALSMYWGWTALERDGASGGKSVWAVFLLDGGAPEARAV